METNIAAGWKDPNLRKTASNKYELGKQDRLAGSVVGGAILGASVGRPVRALVGGIVRLLLDERVNESKPESADHAAGEKAKVATTVREPSCACVILTRSKGSAFSDFQRCLSRPRRARESPANGFFRRQNEL